MNEPGDGGDPIEEVRRSAAAYADLAVLSTSPGVTIRRAVEAEVERIYVERTMPDGGVRYVRVTWAGDAAHGGVSECYALRGGLFGTPEGGRDFDGGTYGTLPAIVDFARRWIVLGVEESQWAVLAREVPTSLGSTQA